MVTDPDTLATLLEQRFDAGDGEPVAEGVARIRLEIGFLEINDCDDDHWRVFVTTHRLGGVELVCEHAGSREAALEAAETSLRHLCVTTLQQIGDIDSAVDPEEVRMVSLEEASDDVADQHSWVSRMWQRVRQTAQSLSPF